MSGILVFNLLNFKHFSDLKLQNFITFLNSGCYAMKYGSRGYGHSGFSGLGLMSDAKDLEWQWYKFILKLSKKKFFFLNFNFRLF